MIPQGLQKIPLMKSVVGLYTPDYHLKSLPEGRRGCDVKGRGKKEEKVFRAVNQIRSWFEGASGKRVSWFKETKSRFHYLQLGGTGLKCYLSKGENVHERQKRERVMRGI